jgi:thiosulfate dehydrogenase [quinone] large subunit
MNLLNVLSVEQWLAILRIGVGLWWLKSVFHKRIGHFLREGMVNWSISLAENHPVPAYGAAMKGLLSSTRSWFPYVQLFGGEFAVGVGLTLGFLTPIAAIVGIFLNLNFIALAGVKPKNIDVNPCFRVEQGQNWNMILAELIVLATGAGAVWSVDSLLGLFV